MTETSAPTRADAAMAALRERGAQRLDPVRWAYLQALARRAAAHEGQLRDTLYQRLGQAVAAYAQAFDSACTAAQARCAEVSSRFPPSAAALRRHLSEADFNGLQRLAAELESQARPKPLAKLVRHIEEGTGALDNRPPITAVAPPVDSAVAPPPQELRALRLFKDTWARLSIDQQLARSLAQVPANPGPLNSQLLVLRALRLMQQTSPAYLAHFVSYAKTLMWLEQASAAVAPTAAAPTRRDTAGAERKPKPARSSGKP